MSAACEIIGILTRLEWKVNRLMTMQQQFDADMTKLQAFLADLVTELQNIQTILANQGVTNVGPLDALVAQAQQIQPQIDALGGATTNPPTGTPPTGTPPNTTL